MVQPASPTSVEGDFTRRTVVLRGREYGLESKNGKFIITESFLTGLTQSHEVQYVLGSRRIQHYLTTVDQGRIIILPPSWDVERRQWFHNMDIVRPDLDEHSLVQQWNKNCVGCHVSQEHTNYSPVTRSYATAWMDFGTSCEQCHGPGSRHVALYRSRQNNTPVTNPLIVRPTRLSPEKSSMICAQCHSLRATVAPGFNAGDDYSDSFQPILDYGTRGDNEPSYWIDGRPRRFANDAVGLWESECFRKGGAACTTCHQNPHFPNVDRDPQLLPTNNALCTQCHQTLAQNVTEHTRHPVNSSGSSCVECHMPKTVVSIKSTMRDHSMSLPAPEATVAYGIPNACTTCHSDKNASWAIDVLKSWRPDGQRKRILTRASAFASARERKPDAVARLIAIANDPDESAITRANALGYLRDFPSSTAAAAALLTNTRDTQPIVRAVAFSSLGSMPPSSEVRSALVNGLSDVSRAVRISALVSMTAQSPQSLTTAESVTFRRVGEEFAAVAHEHEDDATSQRDLGLLHLLTGNFESADFALANSLALEPLRASTKYLLALAKLGRGQMNEARTLLRQVPQSDPSYKFAQDRLKQLSSEK